MGLVSSAISSAATWFGGIGLGTIAVVGGAIIVVAAASYGAYKLYQYCTKTEKVSEAKVYANKPPTIEEIKTLQWSVLNITDEQLKQIKILTKHEFLECVQEFTCLITRMIMKEPRKLGCCYTCFQKKDIEEWLNLKKTCPKCRKSRTTGDLQRSIMAQKAIEMFRFEVRKTFLSLTKQEDKEEWEVDIDRHFGIGYVKTRL